MPSARKLVSRLSSILASAAILGTAACENRRTGERDDGRLAALPFVDVVGKRAREPMIVQGRDGALFVSGYGEDVPVLWRSVDDGQTWMEVDIGTAVEGAVGNSDVDLAAAPDGTLYFVVMSYDRTKYEGTGIAVASSRDAGATWTWTSLSRDRFDDRPWVEVASDGTAHVIWNDGGGQSHAVSKDRGLTWAERPRIHSRGGSSHLAISPMGAIAVRVTPLSASAHRFDPGVDFISVSTDGGQKWTLRNLPGTREWQAFDEERPMLRWVEPVAWDSTGALYSLWSEGTSIWVGRSSDHGVSWNVWRIAQSSSPVYFPYLVARGRGELAASWFSGLEDSIKVHVAHIMANGEADHPLRVRRAVPFAIPSFERSDSLPARRRDTAGEYIPIMFLGPDRVAVVTTIQDQSRGRYGFTFRQFFIRR